MRWVLIVLTFAFVALEVNYQEAMAATTTLICTFSGNFAAGPAQIVLNEAAGSITIYHPPIHNPGGMPNPIPSSLRGTFAANFSPTAISFVDEEGNPRTLNRLSGTIEWYGTNRHPIGSIETCAVGKPQF
jgi:hypothetical protein